MQKSLRKYWKVIAWCLIMFTLSSIPTLPKAGIIWWDFLLKKSAHVFEYLILYVLYFQAMGKDKNLMTPFLFALAFALSDEYHQSFVTGRTAKFTDVGFDTFGMLIGYYYLRNKNCQEN